MNHYTYILLDPKSEMKYVGVRSCKCAIVDDPYKGSSNYMTPEEKDRCVKVVLGVYDTREQALDEELRLHKELNVVSNRSYWNKALSGVPPKGVRKGSKYKSSDSKKGVPLSAEHIESLKKAQQKRWAEGRGPEFPTGENHPARKFKSVYEFRNLSGEVFVGTNLEFKKHLNVRYIQTVNKIVTGAHSQYKKWYIVRNITSGCQTTDMAYVTAYKWYNTNTEETFIGTGQQLVEHAPDAVNLGRANKVIRGDRNHTGGWTIVGIEA